MRQRSKKYQNWKDQYWTNKHLSLVDSLQILKKHSLEKFNSTLNLVFHLNLNAKKPEHNLRGYYNLPKAASSKIIIAVFSKTKQNEAEAAGVQIVGGVELIEKIAKTKKIEFDIALATPEIVRDLSKIAPILGPKKLMPTSKNGTVSLELTNVIKEFQSGRKNFQTDGSKCLQFVLGKLSDSIEDLTANYHYLLDKVIQIRPQSIKGKYIKGLHLSGTMTPGFRLELHN